MPSMQSVGVELEGYSPVDGMGTVQQNDSLHHYPYSVYLLLLLIIDRSIVGSV